MGEDKAEGELSVNKKNIKKRYCRFGHYCLPASLFCWWWKVVLLLLLLLSLLVNRNVFVSFHEISTFFNRRES